MHIACPKGLDWDGVSCDLIIREDDDNDSEVSHWSIIGGQQTLILMFLASLVIVVISLMRSRTANKLRTLDSTSKHEHKVKVGNSRMFRTPLVNRVDDLSLQPS